MKSLNSQVFFDLDGKSTPFKNIWKQKPFRISGGKFIYFIQLNKDCCVFLKKVKQTSVDRMENSRCKNNAVKGWLAGYTTVGELCFMHCPVWLAQSWNTNSDRLEYQNKTSIWESDFIFDNQGIKFTATWNRYLVLMRGSCISVCLSVCISVCHTFLILRDCK